MESGIRIIYSCGLNKGLRLYGYSSIKTHLKKESTTAGIWI